MLVLYICWVIALTLLSSKVNGAHFLSNLCTETKIGTYSYPGVNNVYFECEYGNATIYACPPGTNFNPIFMICSKRDVPYERKDCFNNGLYLPHPFDCGKFIECLNSEIKVIDCKSPMVYSIDTGRCEYRRKVSACRRTSADVHLRTDLNTYIHYNPNAILGKKRDILHELTDLDEGVEEESGESNVDSLQFNRKLDAPIQNEAHDDDSYIYSSKKNSPNKISINFSNTIPRRSKKNFTKMIKKDKLSIQDINLLLRGLGAPFNIALINNNKNISNSDKAFIESFKNLLEVFLLTSLIDGHNETSTENFNLPLQTNTSSPNVNVSKSVTNDLMTSTNEARQFPDDIKIVTQPIETTSPILSFSEQSEEKKTINVKISEEIQSANDFSQKRNTSTLASDETSTALKQMEDVVSNTTPMVEITNNTIDLEQHSDTSILPSTPFMSTSEIAETTLRYSNNDVTVTVDSIVSQRKSTSFLSTTSTSVSDITNTDIGSTDDEKIKEISSVEPKELNSRIDVIDEIASSNENVEEVEKIHVNDSTLTTVKSTIVPELVTEVSSSASAESSKNQLDRIIVNYNSNVQINQGYSKIHAVDLNGEKIEDTNKVSLHYKEKSSSSPTTSRSLDFATDIAESDSGSVLEVTEAEETSISNYKEVKEPIEINENLESTTSTLIIFNTESTKLKEVDEVSEDIESTPVSTQLVEITSSTIAANRVPEKAEETTDRSTLAENVSEVETSTSLLSTSSRPSDDTEDITAPNVTPTRPEHISTTDNQNNDEIPTTLEHVSNFVENQRNEEISTRPTDNILINKSNITNQEIPDAPKIENERFPRNVDSEIAQVEESNDDKIRPSTFIEPANLTEIKKYPSFVYAWHDAKSMRTISISKQRLRLNGTSQGNYGYVEVKGVDDIWRGVCQPTYWTIAEADIICQELGYQNGAHKAWKGHSNRMDIPAWTATSSIQCDGDEEWVNKCRFQDETECDLQHNAVGVECLLHDATTY